MARTYLEFCSLKNLLVLSYPPPPPKKKKKTLDGMLVHPGLPQRYVAITHLYTYPAIKRARHKKGGVRRRGWGKGGVEVLPSYQPLRL